MLMALSWFILRARYRLIHFIAVAVCLLGVGTMVGADILAGRQEGEGKELGQMWNNNSHGILIFKGEREKRRKLLMNRFSLFQGQVLRFTPFQTIELLSFQTPDVMLKSQDALLPVLLVLQNVMLLLGSFVGMHWPLVP